MDQRFSTHLLLVILGLTVVTIAQEDQIQCVKEDNPLKGLRCCETGSSGGGSGDRPRVEEDGSWRAFFCWLWCLVLPLMSQEKACPNNWICPSNETCGNNTTCRCRKGYFQDFIEGVVLCADINECAKSHTCGNGATCKNTIGSFYCECDTNLQGNSTQFCPNQTNENYCKDVKKELPLTCLVGTLPPNTTNCNNRICPEGQEYNVSFPCIPGYEEVLQECVDIHECFAGTHACGYYSKCKNTKGGYNCTCKAGYHKGNQTAFCPSNDEMENMCTDINECTDVPGICGSNLICKNTPGSYKCICDNGFTHISDTCEDVQSQSKGQHQNTVCSVLQGIIAHFNVSCHSNVKLTTKEAETQLENDTKRLSDILEEYNTLSTPDSPNTGIATTTILKNVEIVVMKSFIDAPRNQTIITPQLAISMKVSSDLCTSVGMFFSLMLNDNLMEVPCDQLDRDTDGGVFIVYKDLDSNLNGNILKSSQISEDDDDMAIVNSRVVTGAITRTLTSQVTFKLAHIRDVKYFHNPVCVFWDPKKNGWSTDGCTTKSSESNDTHTTCSCNHLSSFAVIMAPLGPQVKDNAAITILSYIGLILSVLCLALTLLTFVLCRTLRSAHTSVLTALCSCLFLGQFLFLVGINQISNKILCSVIAGGLHFLFLCAFCWMSIESVMLFMTVRNLRAVNYMTSHRLNFPMMSLLGFGIPALIVGISAAIEADGYGTDKNCWLRPNSTIWGFLGPVAVFIVINTALLVFTIILLRKRLATLNTNVSTLKNSRSLTFKALAQFFILGCTWGFGFFQFRNGSLIVSYVFTISNSLQGVYIFLVHCVFNVQVRQEYKKQFCKARKRGKLSMDDSTPNNVSKSVTLTEISKPVTSEKSTTETKINWTQD